MYTKFTSPLENIRIASPCSANWEEMYGNERKRFCGECKLNVYNLSGMSSREAENLILQSEGKLCVRFFRRSDGSVLTKDCPVGWQAIKRRVSKTAAAFASLFFTALSGIGLANYFVKSPTEVHTMGAITRTMGEIAIDDSDKAIQGKPLMKTMPTNTEEYSLGTMNNISATQEKIKNRRKL